MTIKLLVLVLLLLQGLNCWGQSSALLMANISSSGTISVVQAPAATSPQATGQTSTVATGYGFATGNKLLIGWGSFNAAVTPTSLTLSDSVTTCTRVTGGGQDDGNPGVDANTAWWFWCPALPSGITGWTVAHPPADYPCTAAIEVANATSSPVDATSTPHNPNDTTWSTNSVTPTASQTDVLGAFIYEPNVGTLTVSTSGFTMGGQVASPSIVNCGTAYKVQSGTTGSYTINGAAGGHANTTALSIAAH